jgi:hypothetical protein
MWAASGRGTAIVAGRSTRSLGVMKVSWLLKRYRHSPARK